MASHPTTGPTHVPRISDETTQALRGDVITDEWPEDLTIQDYLEQLAAAGEIELADDTNIIWCERCGAATDGSGCGCLRYVKRVG